MRPIQYIDLLFPFNKPKNDVRYKGSLEWKKMMQDVKEIVPKFTIFILKLTLLNDLAKFSILMHAIN